VEKGLALKDCVNIC